MSIRPTTPVPSTPITPDIKHVPLSSQVGGHPGVMTSEDGSLLIKQALPVEVQFYQSVLADPYCEPLRPFVPKFYGTLRLEGQIDAENSADGAIAVTQESVDAMDEVEKDESHSIVLENLSSTFSKPNILDIKLGTVLYDESASEDKRQRMLKTARETTSLETGVRLTGFQVYDLSRDAPVNVPKSYGKSLKPADLPDGIAQFFPHSPHPSRPSSPNSSPPPEYAHTSDPHEMFNGTGLPPEMLLPILESLREDIAEIRAALTQVHLRMVGASLLIVYEADWKRCREGLKRFREDGSDDDCDEDEDDDDDDEDEDEDAAKPGPPYIVKLIDFAHTRIVPGQGPDQGVLTGIDTVLKLLDGRIHEIKALLDDESYVESA